MIDPTNRTALDCLRIEGGVPLEGRIRVAGNKNGALPLLAASLLCAEPVVLENVPRIRDVETMLELMSELGVDVSWVSDNEVRVDGTGLNAVELNAELVGRIRGSVLLAGPLLSRLGEVVLPAPGGDGIGRRRLDVHLEALSALGAEVAGNGRLHIRSEGLKGTRVFLEEASVTATENAVMASVLADGVTAIGNAASEPHVQDLCRFLNSVGARISGIGSNRLFIEGVERLSGGPYRVGPDHVEVGSLIGLAAVCRGQVTIEGVVLDDLEPILPAFARLGVQVSVLGDELIVPAGQELRVRNDHGGQIPKIEDGPWPAFPADLTSIVVAVATQSEGEVLVFEKMFENRLFFVDKLVQMGARIVQCDPHRVIVSGPANLYGQRMDSPDIRAGMSLLIAALCAEGESIIGNAHQLNRGYERLAERLQGLGARIEADTA